MLRSLWIDCGLDTETARLVSNRRASQEVVPARVIIVNADRGEESSEMAPHDAYLRNYDQSVLASAELCDSVSFVGYIEALVSATVEWMRGPTAQSRAPRDRRPGPRSTQDGVEGWRGGGDCRYN